MIATVSQHLVALVLASILIENPVLFVTQVPKPEDFTTITSTFGNHSGQIDSVPRGGDLWIRYPDGSLKNLTRAAGFGMDGLQGANAIAVRDPHVHWSGTKALFSMVIGAPQQYQWNPYVWQIYEITGLGKTDTPVIRKIAKQPADYNNVTPIYGTDERILFTSDRPRSGERHLYPQLDEYEEAPTVTGLWKLDPESGAVNILNHSPSGVFTPFIDSFGRVLFTRWDHLQRDQQADADAEEETYGTFDYADESENAARLNQRLEVFPEPRSSRTDLLAGTNLEGLSINHFFPWEINEDGTAEETLNHVGRHELHGYFNRVFNDDAALSDFSGQGSGRMNENDIQNLFQLREDPTHPGRYFGVDAPEFQTHAAGQIISLEAEPTRVADQIRTTFVTARATRDVPDGVPGVDHSGHYRDPLPLSNGTLLAVHTSEPRADENDGGRANPTSRYAFRIKKIEAAQNGVHVATEALTPGIPASISYWDPDVLVTWSGTLWELSPVEVRARPRPVPRVTLLEEPEAKVFREEGVDPERFRGDIAKRNLALVVSRDVTVRDAADKQQPYNLKVAGSPATNANGKVYDLAFLQFFQGNQVRGVGGTDSPRAGRRVLARPSSTVKIAADGSAAALVPAQRAMSWQTTDPHGTPVVRERYWLTFQPGEVRVCNSCHGVNSRDQLGRTAPQNSPEALRALLKVWKAEQSPVKKKGRAVRK
jgi:hypothetical protein